MDAIGLRGLNRIVAKHVEVFGTREDFKILLEIAASQQEGIPLTLKRLMLCVDIPQSTMKRRLSRLVRRRFVTKQMTPNDRRVHCYSVPEKTQASLNALVADIRKFNWR
jgi:DNA-binding MarR family transcriptional regulator